MYTFKIKAINSVQRPVLKIQGRVISVFRVRRFEIRHHLRQMFHCELVQLIRVSELDMEPYATRTRRLPRTIGTTKFLHLSIQSNPSE